MSGRIEPTSELSRDLTLFHITMMGLGMMIGAGVFVGVGNAIHDAGPGGVILTFALNGVIAIFTAMSYAELSSAIPRAGGAYNFARVAFGRGPSFLAGWMEWFASSVAGSLYAVTFGIYVVRFVEAMGWLDVPEPYTFYVNKFVALCVAVFFLMINYRGASETGKVGAFFTLGQTLFLVCIGVAGIYVAVRDPGRFANFDPFLPKGWSALLVTMGFTYVAFEGYEVIAQAGDEAIDPKRNLPKAMLYSVAIVTVTYVAVAFATVVAVRASNPELAGEAVWRWIGSHGDTGFGEAIAVLLPGKAVSNILLTLAVIFASTSALNATIYSATRASYALGRDRMLPGFFATISARRRTPYVALIFTGAIAIVVATVLPTKHVAASASIMFLFLFFMVNICVITVRRNMVDELSYGYLMPLFPVFPIAAILCQALLAAGLFHKSLVAWTVAAVWIGAGGAIYRLWSRRNAVSTAEDVQVLEERRLSTARTDDRYRIMVAVANPENAVQLVRGTYKLSQAKQASVELLHMVPVPDQVPLSDARQYMLQGREGILEVMISLAMHFPISTTIRYCRSFARGIVSAVRTRKTNLLILGWHGQGSSTLFHLGSTVDPVVERAPCNVVVLKDCGGNQPFRRVLVPVAGGPNSAFALEVATILAEPDAEIVAFTASRGDGEFDVRRFVRDNRYRLHIDEDRISAVSAGGESIVGTILEHAADYDLVVIGCTRQSLLHKLTHETIPEQVARQCRTPLAMVNAGTGLRSWIRRWM